MELQVSKLLNDKKKENSNKIKNHKAKKNEDERKNGNG